MKQKRIIAWILSFAMILSLFGSVPLTASAQTEGENESVTVYFTLSRDGEFVTGNDTDRTMLAHVPVTVDYFDLADYGLEDFTDMKPMLRKMGEHILVMR